MYKLAVLGFFALTVFSISEALRIFPQNIELSPCADHPLCHYQGHGNWRHVGRAEADQEHSVTIAVKLSENAADTCDSLLYEISTPGNARYGQHMTLEEVAKLTSNRKSRSTVMDWLRNFDLNSIDVGQDFVKVTATVAVIEQMFSTELHNFQHSNGKMITRAASYGLPEEIAIHVDLVGNLVNIPMMNSGMAFSSSADGKVTPPFLQEYYNINAHTVSNHASQAVFESLGQNYSPDDLKQFQNTYNLPNDKINQYLGRGNAPSMCEIDEGICMESNLDVQYMMAIAQNSNFTYYSIDSTTGDDWIFMVSSDPKPPMVHSISYGSLAPEVPSNDVTRFNTELCKLGLRGVTVVVASGDDGVAGFFARSMPSYCGFTPSFPATSPYVLAVGATSGPEKGQPEVACSSADGNVITTGGGFSYWFPRPSYQEDVVNNYLKNGPNMPPLNLFNSTHRGYPDVSLIGVQYQVIIAGQTYSVFGTSASTPVFGGMLTLINDMRIANGKSSLGFVNPTLYQIAAQPGQDVFNDITSGENNCALGHLPDVTCCPYGFTATTGWDPVTGLGSVNFKNLADKLVNL